MFPQNATVALNPLQWFATDDGWLDWGRSPALPDLFAEITRAGFEAVSTRVPAGLTAAEYGRAVADAGLTLVPGTAAFSLPENTAAEQATLDSFAATATAHAELGLHHLFVLNGMRKDAPRVARPGRGTDADPDRLKRISDLLARIGEVASAAGILPILHPHAGTWIETAEETRYILDHVDPQHLGFGPDAGHLSWAGADPAELVAEYRDRVFGIHVKDYRASVLDESKAADRTYQETVLAGLWTEPGRGDLDYTRVWEALGADYTGALVIEVDRGDLTPPFESAKACATWLHTQQTRS